MKKNFTLSVMLFLVITFVATSANSVFAQNKAICSSDKNKIESVSEFRPNTQPNAVSATVVINEVFGGSEMGNSYNADFIELFNISNMPVNISDYSVQYYTAGQINGGAPTSTAHIPDGTILQPLSYFVIRISPADRSGRPLPCENLNASASFAETGIATGGGKLILTSTGADLADCTSTLNVIDRVGWGITPVTCNEISNVVLQSNSVSIQRRLNAPDTDDNGADFTSLGVPTPCTTLGPTNATAAVSGKVYIDGNIIARALVSITDSNGMVSTVRTNSFGYFRFDELPTGQIYIFTVTAKSYSFASQVVIVNEDLMDFDFNSL